MRLLDRVILIRDYKVEISNIILKKGTIGTVRNIDLNDIVTLQLSCPEILVQALVPKMILRNCEECELENVRYETITPAIFHIGNLWSISDEYDENGNSIYQDGVIVNYKLALNENRDKIYFCVLDDIKLLDDKKVKNIKSKIYTKKYMEEFGSYSSII